MRITLPWIAVIGLLGSAGPVRADYDLVVKKNCLACHYVDKRKYGPSFQQVAAKYADQKDAADMLAKKIMTGGAGVWGEDMMPPQSQVSASEARTIATYVLSLK
ncbi:c-type cytochrome [Roseateles sp.]|uniref:c-type cytochrome n=1 Tax=Roseateles sp. TaxID=1971397 RepID=UPI00286C3B28|nr:c-type cytochrome [Roseateles sp.]